jgi:hypothetical protein
MTITLPSITKAVKDVWMNSFVVKVDLNLNHIAHSPPYTIHQSGMESRSASDIRKILELKSITVIAMSQGKVVIERGFILTLSSYCNNFCLVHKSN